MSKGESPYFLFTFLLAVSLVLTLVVIVLVFSVRELLYVRSAKWD